MFGVDQPTLQVRKVCTVYYFICFVCTVMASSFLSWVMISITVTKFGQKKMDPTLRTAELNKNKIVCDSFLKNWMWCEVHIYKKNVWTLDKKCFDYILGK